MAGFADPQKAQVDVPLSMFAQQYKNAEFIGDLVCPRVEVGEQSGTYWIFGREHLETPLVEGRLHAGPVIEARTYQSLATSASRASNLN